MMDSGFLGIEIGDKTCRYVFLQKGKNGYQITRAGKSSSEGDVSSPGALYSFVRKLADQDHLSPKRIFLTLNFSDLLVHQITVPQMTRPELAEVVSGEIEKVPRFYHRAYDFLFRQYPSRKDKSGIVYAAVPRDTVSNLLTDCRKLGVPCRDIEIAPLNLKGLLPIPADESGAQAVLVVNEQNSFLSVVEKGQYRFLYRSSLGLEQIGSIASATAKEHVLLNWMGELRRALKACQLEHKSAPLKLVWLVWDKEALPDLDDVVGRELGLETEVLYTKKIRRVSPSQEAYQNPAFAMALTPVVHYLNRWRPHFALNHFARNFNIRAYLIKAAAVAALIVGLAGIVFLQMHHRLQAGIRSAKAETKDLQKIISRRQEDAKALYQQRDDYLRARTRLLEQAGYVNALNRVSWSQVLAVVSHEHPEDLALTSFKFSENGRASIRGQAFEVESIANLMRQIDVSTILEKGEFDFLKERDFQGIPYYEFGLSARLKATEKDHTDDAQGD